MVFHSNNPISVYEVSKLKQHLTGILPNVQHATWTLKTNKVLGDENEIFGSLLGAIIF